MEGSPTTSEASSSSSGLLLVTPTRERAAPVPVGASFVALNIGGRVFWTTK